MGIQPKKKKTPVPTPKNPNSRRHRFSLQQFPHPLDPPQPTLQHLQPRPLLLVPPLQHRHPLFQPRPRLPLRRHHLVRFRKQLRGQLLQLLVRLADACFGRLPQRLFARQ